MMFWKNFKTFEKFKQKQNMIRDLEIVINWNAKRNWVPTWDIFYKLSSLGSQRMPKLNEK